MPVKWEDKLDVKFLCTILKALDAQVGREGWAKIAQTMGSEFTAEACRLRYAKVQREAGVRSIATATTAVDTPPSPAPGRKRKPKAAEDCGPEKSPKKSKKASTILPKKEEENEFTPVLVKSEFTSDPLVSEEETD